MSGFFIEEDEPEHKTPFVTLKVQNWLWDGEGWMQMSVTYSSTHPGQIRDEIRTTAKQKREMGGR